MSEVHRFVLLQAAREVAELFGSDPGVAALIDPAVWIDANEDGYAATIIERLEVVDALSGFPLAEGPGVAQRPPDDSPITVVVVHHFGSPPSARIYNVPDPRKEPGSWPWTGPDDDEK